MTNLIAEARELCNKADNSLMKIGGHRLTDPCISVSLYNQLSNTHTIEPDLRTLVSRCNRLIPELCDALENTEKQLQEQFDKTGAWLEEYNEMKIALEKAARWMPVTEHRPKIGEAVLTVRVSAIHKARYIDILRFEGSHWRDGGSGPKVLLSQVSHWMPLPAPPEEGAEHERD